MGGIDEHKSTEKSNQHLLKEWSSQKRGTTIRPDNDSSAKQKKRRFVRLAKNYDLPAQQKSTIRPKDNFSDQIKTAKNIKLFIFIIRHS